MRTALAYIVLMLAELPALVYGLCIASAQWLDPRVLEDRDEWDDWGDGDGPYGF